MLYLKLMEVFMPTRRAKKLLTSLQKDIKAIRQRKPTDAQIEELNKVLEKRDPKDLRQIARTPEVQN